MPAMARITLRAAPTLAAGLMSLPQASHIFQPQDDLSFLSPSPGYTLATPNGPAVQTYYPNQDPTVINGVSSGSSGLPPQYRLSEGNYSWMATIVPNAPIVATNDSHNYSPYTVSIVVYYKRPISLSENIATPAELAINNSIYELHERVATVSAFSGGGIGGGEVTLSTANASGPTGASYLNIKRGQWIMLAGQMMLPSPSPLNPSGYSANINVFRWYRVVSADDVVDTSGVAIQPSSGLGNGGPYTRNVTLAGPDWPVLAISQNNQGSNYNPNPNSNSPTNNLPTTTFAYICDGVVGVYEKTMELERPSEWSSQ
jgi:hypothetical protein